MIYLDEKIASHRKILRAGRLLGDRQGGTMAALGLFVAAIGYSRAHLTDGVVPDEFLQEVSRNRHAILSLHRAKLIKKLRGNRWAIHDYLAWNKSAGEVREEQRKTRARQARFRDGRKGGNGGGNSSGGGANGPVTPLRNGEGSSRLFEIPDPRSPIPDPRSPVDRSTSSVREQGRGESTGKIVENSGSAARDLQAPRTSAPPNPAARLSRQVADDGNYAVIEKLAHAVLEEHGDDPESPDVVDALKAKCGELKISYQADPRIVRRALVSAATQRVLVPATPSRTNTGSLADIAQRLRSAPDAAALGAELKNLTAAATRPRR